MGRAQLETAHSALHMSHITCLSKRAHARRVRLYNKGDSISTEHKKSKLKREYKKMHQLSQLIYWGDVGREGSDAFEDLMRQKKMAEAMKETLSGELSVEKAQKMISKALEAQKKADMARAVRSSKGSAAAAASRSREAIRNPGARRNERGHYRSPRSQQRNERSGRSRSAKNRGRGGARPSPATRAPNRNRA